MINATLSKSNRFFALIFFCNKKIEIFFGNLKKKLKILQKFFPNLPYTPLYALF